MSTPLQLDERDAGRLRGTEGAAQQSPACWRISNERAWAVEKAQ
jgi:hypothetical protein